MTAPRHLDWEALDRARTGECSSEEREHLESCEDCRAELAAIRGLARTFKSAASAPMAVPEDREREILGAARARAEAIRTGKLVRMPWWRRPASMAMAASLMAGISVVWLTLHEPPRSPAVRSRSDLDAARERAPAKASGSSFESPAAQTAAPRPPERAQPVDSVADAVGGAKQSSEFAESGTLLEQDKEKSVREKSKDAPARSLAANPPRSGPFDRQAVLERAPLAAKENGENEEAVSGLRGDEAKKAAQRPALAEAAPEPSKALADDSSSVLGKLAAKPAPVLAPTPAPIEPSAAEAVVPRARDELAAAAPAEGGRAGGGAEAQAVSSALSPGVSAPASAAPAFKRDALEKEERSALDRPSPGAGLFVGATGDAKSPGAESLQVVGTEIVVRLGANVVKTVRQRFENPDREPVVARYVLPLASDEAAGEAQLRGRGEALREAGSEPPAFRTWEGLRIPAGEADLEVDIRFPSAKAAPPEIVEVSVPSALLPESARAAFVLRLEPAPGYELGRPSSPSHPIAPSRVGGASWSIELPSRASSAGHDLIVRVPMTRVPLTKARGHDR